MAYQPPWQYLLNVFIGKGKHIKKLVSLVLTLAIMFGVISETAFAFGSDKSRTYESENCTISYMVANEWDRNQQIVMSITNNGDETIRNWAVKFNTSGTVLSPWNTEINSADSNSIVLRNCGYNYEIMPNATIEFGFQLNGDALSFPESVSLCNKVVDSTDKAEVSYEIYGIWDNGFNAQCLSKTYQMSRWSRGSSVLMVILR